MRRRTRLARPAVVVPVMACCGLALLAAPGLAAGGTLISRTPLAQIAERRAQPAATPTAAAVRSGPPHARLFRCRALRVPAT